MITLYESFGDIPASEPYVQQLSERYQFVFHQRKAGSTQRAIATELGISQTRIAQIERRIKRQINTLLIQERRRQREQQNS